MRLVHTGDWHIGKSLNEFSLLEDQVFFLDRLVSLLAEEKADALLVSGDIYDRSVPPAEAVELVGKTFERIALELKIPVYAIAGNHDSAQRLSFATELFRAGGLYLESSYTGKIARFTLHDDFGDVQLYLLPYLSTAQTRARFPSRGISTSGDAFAAVLAEESFDPSVRNVLVAHGFFGFGSEEKPLLSDSETSVGGSELCDLSPLSEFDYVALGHLHAPQKVGLAHIRYAGSLLKYSVSEATQRKSVCIIDLNEKGDVQIDERVIAPLRDLRVIRGTLAQLLDTPGSDDYVFAELTDQGPVLDGITRLRDKYRNVLGLRLLAREKELQSYKSDLHEKMHTDEVTLFQRFFETVKKQPMTEAQLDIMRQIVTQAKKNML